MTTFNQSTHRLLVARILGGLLFAWAPVQISGSSFVDPFTPINLGVGGDQHECGTTSFFTNIVASAVGDLDGDGIQDIVLLSNAVPPNGAYKTTAVTYPDFNMWFFRNGWTSSYASVTFLNSGDRLYGVDNGTILPIGFNPTDTPQPWFTAGYFSTFDAGLQPRINTLHFAPPSPNVVMGMVDGYTGSEVAWLRGDGRGNFNLMFVTPFGPDGVTPAPVRIRMGFQLILAKMRDPGQVGLDIVLASKNDMLANYTDVEIHGLYPSNTTSIKPFEGTGRVFWLENRGWNGSNDNLQFVDHSIAEYNCDRPATTFFQIYSPAGSPYWNPNGTLYPSDIQVRDINQDGRPDVVVAADNSNVFGTTYSTSTYSGTPDALTFDGRYSPDIRRPVIGELWWEAPRSYTSEVLYWYENKLIAGQTQLSTATFSVARDSSHAKKFHVWNVPWKGVAFLRLADGKEAVAVRGLTYPVYNRYVIRREMPPDATYPLTLLSSYTITGLNNEYFGVYGADLNNDGADELLADEFRCIAGIDCIARLHIYTVTPSGADDVDVHHETTIAPPSSYPVHTCPPWAIADFNQDGFNDLVSPTAGSGTSDKPDPFNLFLSAGPGAALTYRPLRQKSPVTGHVALKNVFKGSEKLLDPLSFISIGDFNSDGFPDIVKTGPSIPATLFMNNIGDMQRAVVKTTSKHKTGTSSTWTTILGGEYSFGNLLISTTPLAQVMDTP
jgi:hypothetical protein